MDDRLALVLREAAAAWAAAARPGGELTVLVPRMFGLDELILG